MPKTVQPSTGGCVLKRELIPDQPVMIDQSLMGGCVLKSNPTGEESGNALQPLLCGWERLNAA